MEHLMQPRDLCMGRDRLVKHGFNAALQCAMGTHHLAMLTKASDEDVRIVQTFWLPQRCFDRHEWWRDARRVAKHETGSVRSRVPKRFRVQSLVTVEYYLSIEYHPYIGTSYCVSSLHTVHTVTVQTRRTGVGYL